MKIKTSELSGAALDWAVAKANNWSKGVDFTIRGAQLFSLHHFGDLWRPSTNWGQGGPLIEEYIMRVVRSGTHTWMAECEGFQCVGPTPLVAACRAIVAAELGPEVEIPEELTNAE